MKTTIAVLCIGAAAMALARAEPQQTPPVFRSTTNVVALDVTVVDKDGKPVTGLKASDFAVTLDGQQRAVQTVDFVEFGSASAVPSDPALAAPAAPATPGSPSSKERRVVVILFDDQSITPIAGRSLIVAANRTIDQFGPDDAIGVTSISGIVPAVNPTTDRAIVKAAVSRLVGRADVNPTAPFFISVDEAAQIANGDISSTQTLERVTLRECVALGLIRDRGDTYWDACEGQVRGASVAYTADLRNRVAMQMEAYKTIISRLRTFKGAKVVIALSGGVAINSDPMIVAKQLEPIVREAAETGVRFYGMAEETDMTSMTSRTSEQERARVASDRAMFDGLATVAVAAGGEAFHVIGQADRFFTRIEVETSAIYRLGIDAPPNATSARYINAKVSVKLPGVTVRANRKALSVAAAPVVVPVDDQLRAAVQTGGIDAAVPVRIATTVRRELSGAAMQVGVNLEIPADVAGPVTAMFSLVDAAGASVKAGRTSLSPASAGQTYFFAFPLAVPAGKYTLRVAAADANGRVGSAEQMVNADVRSLGNLSVSQMLIGWTSPAGDRLLALDAIPADVKTIRAAVEIYPDDAAAMATSTSVHFEFTKVGEKTPITVRDVSPLASGTTLFAAMEIGVANLSPGPYSITATILQAGVAKGSVTAVVRK